MSEQETDKSELWGRKIIIGTDLHRVVDEASEALATDPEIYQRAHTLVRVVRSQRRRRGFIFVSDTPHIARVTTATLRERLTKTTIFEKGSENARTPALPPDNVVAALMDRCDWKVRHLTGIIEAPALRPDGSVIQAAGYDGPTGYLYCPNASYLPVADHPTREDAETAACTLLEVVEDFPFASGAHRSAWLASLLTMFARPAIDGSCPLFAVDGTTRGTGKGMCVDAAMMIAIGRSAVKSPLPEDDTEMRKRITTLVTAGEPVCVLDNVNAPLAFSSLDAVLTSTDWLDRELGKNTAIRGEARTIYFATGNNIQFASDTARRTLHIRIESPLENPENRQDFKHRDLLAWVSSERPRFVHAALTMLRAYVVAGRPDMGIGSWGSFEGWARLIAHCIVWAGQPDCLTTRTELESSSDTTKSKLTALHEVLLRLDPERRGITASFVIRTLFPPPTREAPPPVPDWHHEAREVIEALAPPVGGRAPTSQKLGYTLKQFRNRVISGKRLETAGTKHNAQLWVVREVGAIGTSSPSSSSSLVDLQESNTGEHGEDGEDAAAVFDGGTAHSALPSAHTNGLADFQSPSLNEDYRHE